MRYLGDEFGKSDKIMVIGCLAETFNQTPGALAVYFNDFMQVLLKNSTTNDGQMNRNVSYGIAICAEKATIEQFGPHLNTALETIKRMHQCTEEADAKDNCVAGIVRILDRYHDKMPAETYDQLF